MRIKGATWAKAFIVFIVFPCEGCFVEDALERAKQLRTFSNMQTIAGRIEEIRATAGQVSENQIVEIVHSVAGGRDQWGRPFTYNIRQESSGFAYVLASLGRDGKLDVPSVEAYYSASPESVDYRPDRDIVFLNGEPLRNAGK